MSAGYEPQRDRWGRYLLPDPETGEERAWTRVTTVSGILSDRFNLERWGERTVAFGLAKRPDLVMLASGVRDPKSFGGKKTLNNVAKAAKDAAAGGAAANIGTAIHAAAEAMDYGQEHDLLPAPYDRSLTAYAGEMRRRDLSVFEDESGKWIERIVVLPELGLAGTLDRVVAGGDLALPRVADLKTGGTVKFSHLEHAIQQAVYAHATHYFDVDTGELRPMPAIDKEVAYIIHIPAGEGTCEFHELNIAAGIEAARLAVDVYGNWRKRDDLSRPA